METRDKERIEKWANEIECIPEGECKPGNHCFDCPCAAYTEGLQAGAEYERIIANQQLKEKGKELFELKEEADKQLTFLRNRLSEDREQLAEKEEHIISLKAIIDKLSESDNDVTMAKELAEKDKEIARLETVVKTYSDMGLRAQDQILEMEKQISNWKTLSGLNSNESIAKGLKIVALKEALRRAYQYLKEEEHGYENLKEIENLLK